MAILKRTLNNVSSEQDRFENGQFRKGKGTFEKEEIRKGTFLEMAILKTKMKKLVTVLERKIGKGHL